MKKILVLVLIVGLLVSVPASLVSAEKKQLTLAWCCGQQERKAILEETVANYMAQHPDVSIDVINPTGYTPTIQVWIAGGIAPDVFWYGVAWPTILDSVLPVDDFLAKTKLDKSINPAVLNLLGWEGKIMGVPYGAGAHVVYYNKSIFDQAGLAYPTKTWTWDDAIEMAKRTTIDTNGDGSPNQFGINLSAEYQVHSFLFGGDFYTPDKRKAQFANDATIAGMQLYSDLITNKLGVYGGNFANGNVAMYPNGAFGLGPMRDASFDWDLVTLPALEVNGKLYHNNFMGPESWMIYKGTKYPEVAKDLVRTLMSEDVMAKWGASGTSIPSQTKYAVRYFAGNSQSDRNLVAFVQALDYGHLNHQTHPIGLDIQSFMWGSDLLKGIWKGTTPTVTALPELQKGVNAMLDEYWARVK